MWKQVQWIGLVIVLLGLSSVAWAERITCSVTVVDASAQPVAGAEVAVYECDYAYMQGQLRVNLLGPVRRTDRNGRLTVEWEETGNEVVILARREGLAMDWRCMGRRFLQRRVTLRLGESCDFAGRVADENGRPIKGALVRACPCNQLTGRSVGLPFRAPEDWFTAKTDSEGRFRLTGMAADVWADFWVESPDRGAFWTCEKWDCSPGCQFQAGNESIEIVMPAEARIRGRVIDGEGNGIAGVHLLARKDTRNANYFCPDLVISGADGRFSYEGLTAGTYSLQVVAPDDKTAEWVGLDTQVVCREGETTDDVTVTVGRGGLVELSVIDGTSREPIGNSWFAMTRQARYGRHPGAGKYGRTDDSGRVAVRMPAGTCEVRGGGKDGYSYNSSDPVQVAEGETVQVEILSDRNPFVFGTVKDEEGRPLSDVVVDVLPNGDKDFCTDSTGAFEVSWSARTQGNAPRRYLLAQHLPSGRAALVEIRDIAKPVDLILKPGMTLAGYVKDPAGRPVPAAGVQLGAHLENWYTLAGNEVTTDAEGRYKISAIPPAPEGVKYTISISAAGYASPGYQPLQLVEAAERRYEDLSFMVKPANLSISGIVVNGEGKPVAGKMVHLTGPRGNGEQPRIASVSNERGEFAIYGACEGPLRIQAGYSSDPEGTGYLNAVGGDMNVKVVLGQQLTHTENVSLLGGQLPGWEGIKVPEEVTGKACLVCFWDFSQRPSRHGVNELIKQQEKLAEKKVSVALIHSTAMSAEAEEWIGSKATACHIGEIQAEPETLCKTWGVQGMPWLILTDGEGTVIAEGFPVDELEAKLELVK